MTIAEDKHHPRPTLCWDCANATKPDVCCWCADFKPVPGWDAEPTTKQDGFDAYESYLVKHCPLFVRDGERGGARKARWNSEPLADSDIAAKLDDEDIKIILSYAENGMRVNPCSKELFYDRRTISSKLTGIRLKTGIDPRDYYGLGKLIAYIRKEDVRDDPRGNCEDSAASGEPESGM